MKKRVFVLFIIFLIAALIFIIVIENLNKERNFLKEGSLETSKPQDISIFVLPTPPIIQILSPENATYSTSTILLNYSVKNANSIWYNLDNLENITITSPIFFDVTEGPHILYLYANNSQGTSVKGVTFYVSLPTSPGENGGGGERGGAGGAEQSKKNITKLPEISPNITEPEMPKKNITIPPETPSNITEETPKTTKITIKFLINSLLLVLLIIFIIILVIIIRRKEKFKKKKENKKIILKFYI